MVSFSYFFADNTYVSSSENDEDVLVTTDPIPVIFHRIATGNLVFYTCYFDALNFSSKHKYLPLISLFIYFLYLKDVCFLVMFICIMSTLLLKLFFPSWLCRQTEHRNPGALKLPWNKQELKQSVHLLFKLLAFVCTMKNQKHLRDLSSKYLSILPQKGRKAYNGFT